MNSLRGLATQVRRINIGSGDILINFSIDIGIMEKPFRNLWTEVWLNGFSTG